MSNYYVDPLNPKKFYLQSVPGTLYISCRVCFLLFCAIQEILLNQKEFSHLSFSVKFMYRKTTTARDMAIREIVTPITLMMSSTSVAEVGIEGCEGLRSMAKWVRWSHSQTVCMIEERRSFLVHPLCDH